MAKFNHFSSAIFSPSVIFISFPFIPDSSCGFALDLFIAFGPRPEEDVEEAVEADEKPSVMAKGENPFPPADKTKNFRFL